MTILAPFSPIEDSVIRYLYKVAHDYVLEARALSSDCPRLISSRARDAAECLRAVHAILARDPVRRRGPEGVDFPLQFLWMQLELVRDLMRVADGGAPDSPLTGMEMDAATALVHARLEIVARALLERLGEREN